MSIFIPREPWPAAFPEVIVHCGLAARNGHAHYQAAKSGDPEAAKCLVEDLMPADRIEHISAELSGHCPFLVPVTADEISGFNAIPDAMAQLLGRRLFLVVPFGNFVQLNKVGHTKADGWHRLVTPAIFDGDVISGAEYFLVDDHVGFGGTLANLRGFIEAHGGRVIGATALTETRDARRIALRQETLSMLWDKHGSELDQFWRANLGYGLDCLTEIEAGYLCRVESVARIKDRVAAAAERARGRGLWPAGFAAG